MAVVGVSGFSGEELARCVYADPDLELVAAYSDRKASMELPDPRWGIGPSSRSGRVVVLPQAQAEHAAAIAQIVALATPAEVSAELAPKLVAQGARVIDLSGAFRLPDLDVFREVYRFEHPAPALVREAHYGIPQLPAAAGSEAAPIERARIVANPGCYATAAILAIAPLLRAGLADDGPIFVDGKSGVTGAGRKLADRYLFTEVAENISLYRVVDHQHVPEMEQALRRASGRARVSITFAPHLMPIRRGLITTCFARLAEPAIEDAGARVQAAYREAYGGDPRIGVVPIEDVSVHAVASTPRAVVGAKADPRAGSVVAACAIDNLMKGAATQAHENIRRMLSLP